MYNDKQKFDAVNKDGQSRVYTAAEHYVKSIRTDNVSLNLNQQGNKLIKLENVLYVPELRNNLLLVPTVTEKSYIVTFNKNREFIKRKDGSILTATRRD